MPLISFDRAVEYYDETRGLASGVPEQIRDAIVSHVQATANTRFIELGIGTGRIALPFIEAGYVYDGVDVSAAMMDRLEHKLIVLAAAKGKQRTDYHCDLIQADVTQPLPFADEAYDVGILVHVLHLVEDWQAVLTEAKRILHPDSWLLIVGTGSNRTTQSPNSADTPTEADSVEADPIGRIRVRWDEIIQELGVDRQAIRTGARVTQADFDSFLQTLGATTQIVDLVKYDQLPVTPRITAQRLKDRLYSADWSLPDSIHAEAAKRMDQWFTATYSDPDALIVGKETFRVLTAHFGG